MPAMPRVVYFITHPNVVISRDVPVPDWPLSELGLQRMRRGLAQPWVPGLSAVYSSTERKAMDGGQILADHLSLPLQTVAALGENDRSSTGFLPPAEFENVADAFFARPTESVRGWERAVDAQQRVVSAVSGIARNDATEGAIAIVAHGAVGTLLYCALADEPIARRWDQPATQGGNVFSFELNPTRVMSWWLPFDAA